MAGWKIHENPRSQFGDKIYKLNGSLSMEHCQKMEICMGKLKHPTWWLIPLNKWVITPVISGYNPLTKWDEPPSYNKWSIFQQAMFHCRRVTR